MSHEAPATPPFDALPPFLSHLRADPGQTDGEVPVGPTVSEGSAVENVERSLDAIRRLDPELSAFVCVLGDPARRRAAALDDARSGGEPTRPLHGVTLAIKDCIDLAGVPTTCGTVDGGRRPVPSRTAPAVAALEGAGAVVVGKTNLHEWAFGATSDNPTFGRVRNPHDPDRIPGGSSGGSAVAVATGMAMIALGTDTGGSVRLPASYCGIAGLKVTPGRISVSGVEPLSWTLDTVGLLAPHVVDLDVPYRVLATTGRLSAASLRSPIPPTLAAETAFLGDADRADPSVTELLRQSLDRLHGAGARVERIVVPELASIRETFFRIVLTEGAAVHSGPRYADRPRYGRDIQAALLEGETIRGVDYVNALRARSDVHRALSSALEHCDAIVAPVAPNLPERHGTTSVTWPDGSTEPALEACARLCLPASFAGLPALAVPCGAVGRLPVGMQLIGVAGQEDRLLRVGAWVEAALARGASTGAEAT